MKHLRTLLALAMCVLLLAAVAAADNTVTHTTDEEGHAVTIITDENGNQTIITEAEPGEDDITFDDGEMDLDDEEGEPDETGAPADTGDAETTGASAASAQKGSALGWLVPLFVAVCAAAAVLIVRLVRKKDK